MGAPHAQTIRCTVARCGIGDDRLASSIYKVALFWTFWAFWAFWGEEGLIGGRFNLLSFAMNNDEDGSLLVSLCCLGRVLLSC